MLPSSKRCRSPPSSLPHCCPNCMFVRMRVRLPCASPLVASLFTLPACDLPLIASSPQKSEARLRVQEVVGNSLCTR